MSRHKRDLAPPLPLDDRDPDRLRLRLHRPNPLLPEAQVSCDECICGDEMADDLTCLCVEKGGVCDLPVCKCNQDVAKDGEW